MKNRVLLCVSLSLITLGVNTTTVSSVAANRPAVPAQAQDGGGGSGSKGTPKALAGSIQANEGGNSSGVKGRSNWASTLMCWSDCAPQPNC